MQIFFDLGMPFVCFEFLLMSRYLGSIQSIERHEAIVMCLEKLLSCAEAANPVGRHKIVYPEPNQQLSLAISTFLPEWFDLDRVTTSGSAHED